MENTKELSADVDEIIKYISSPDVTKEELQAYYSKWAPRYNEDTVKTFHGPGYAAEQMNVYCKDKSIRILDVAAGTGILAKKLVSFGFTNIDALDPNIQMIEEAKKMGCYKQYYIDFMGKNRLAINNGGYLVFAMNEKYWFTAPEWTKQFETHMKDLEDEGKWKILVRNKKELYTDGKDYGGFVFVIQKS